MCDCLEKIRNGIMKAMPEADNIIMPTEILSGRSYLEAEKIVIKNGKTKRSTIPVLASYCPFCGEKYPEKGEDNA